MGRWQRAVLATAAAAVTLAGTVTARADTGSYTVRAGRAVVGSKVYFTAVADTDGPLFAFQYGGQAVWCDSAWITFSTVVGPGQSGTNLAVAQFSTWNDCVYDRGGALATPFTVTQVGRWFFNAKFGNNAGVHGNLIDVRVHLAAANGCSFDLVGRLVMYFHNNAATAPVLQLLPLPDPWQTLHMANENACHDQGYNIYNGNPALMPATDLRVFANAGAYDPVSMRRIAG